MNKFFQTLIKEAIGIDCNQSFAQNATNAAQQVLGATDANDAVNQSTVGKQQKGKGKAKGGR